MKITFLRHGRSRADDENVIEGRYDSPLTAAGIQQAELLAAYWRENNPGFDHAECSTLSRARQTAEIVCDALGLIPTPVEEWMEFDNTPIAGMTHEAAQQKYPIPAFRHRYQKFTPDGGESEDAFRRRAATALEQVFQSGAENALVVAHGGVLNMALRALVGCPDHVIFPFGDTAFTVVEVSRNSERVVLRAVAQQPHLAAHPELLNF
ncbi:histidine phosphatase family protein [Deinococcus cellulosilyticus]|nr:histidine phosphatase family protein [Deinococcus cellulosilyticus]